MSAPVLRRLGIRVEGAVQGVGFRPFVYRLARELALAGEVRNTPNGAEIEVEGPALAVDEFTGRLTFEKPPACILMHVEIRELEPRRESMAAFSIAPSTASSFKSAVLLPDLATCPECLAEIRDLQARRHGYPFTNCTNCGPRFTILENIPYDRPHTTMRSFPLCPQCEREYRDPEDRRFHAQPIACPVCGPQLSLAIGEAAQTLRQGQILALQGIGGYQLLADARNPSAVRRLRERKHREEKPFAVLFPDLASLEQACFVEPAERELLLSAAAPIVLLSPRPDHGLASEVSMSSPYLGAMLPYSPLHHLLMAELGFPVVATSGNRSDEPIATSPAEAHVRLAAIADRFLDHNRPIARACDDSVVRIINQRPAFLRRARGYAPLPIEVAAPLPRVLAVGAHQKNTVAIALERRVFLSQHLGDLDTAESCAAFERAIDDLKRLYEFTPDLIACDLHPDYWSTQYAERAGLPLVRIQHHQAHVAAVAAEHQIAEPYLGIAWDGTGYGLDGTIWGSECFRVENHRFERIGHLRPFRLPGGEGAVRDCRRTAFSLLYDANLDPGFLALDQPRVVATMLERGVNSPLTTSMGRLFDAAAVLCGIAQRNAFEGQAPMRLEAAIERSREFDPFEIPLANELDWRPLLPLLRSLPPGAAARRFHNTLLAWLRFLAHSSGCERIVLSGGVFQNAYLAAHAEQFLSRDGFRVFLPQRLPPNDGAIALGQCVLAKESALRR